MWHKDEIGQQTEHLNTDDSLDIYVVYYKNSSQLSLLAQKNQCSIYRFCWLLQNTKMIVRRVDIGLIYTRVKMVDIVHGLQSTKNGSHTFGVH